MLLPHLVEVKVRIAVGLLARGRRMVGRRTRGCRRAREHGPGTPRRRELDPAAVDLAVIAHVRHEHTNYDLLFMRGLERLEARSQVREKSDLLLIKWKARQSPSVQGGFKTKTEC